MEIKEPNSRLDVMPCLQSGEGLFCMLMFITACIACGVYAVALGPDSGFDFWNYHWYSAYALLTSRYEKDLLPSHAASFYNPLINVPFYLITVYCSMKVASFLLGMAQGLNFTLLFMIGYVCVPVENLRQKIVLCALTALLGITGATFTGEIGNTAYDSLVPLGAGLSLLLLLRNHALIDGVFLPGQRAGRLMLLGFPAGLAMGLKLTTMPLCIGLIVCVLASKAAFKQRCFAMAILGAGVLAGFCISYGYWAWHLEANFQSPFFPYFNGLFKSPLADSSFSRDETFVPHGMGEFLFFPFMLAWNPLHGNETAWRDWRMPLVMLAAVGTMLFQIVRSNKTSARSAKESYGVSTQIGLLFLFIACAYIGWLGLFGIYRYAALLEMLSPLLMLLIIGHAPCSAKSRLSILTVLFVLAGVSTVPLSAARDSWESQARATKLPAVDLTGAMVLMAGRYPDARVIDAFPNDVPFVRIDGFFATPGDGQGINGLVAKRLKKHTGAYMLLVHSGDHEQAEKALAWFGLSHIPLNCSAVEAHAWFGDPLLCAVHRE